MRQQPIDATDTEIAIALALGMSVYRLRSLRAKLANNLPARVGDNKQNDANTPGVNIDRTEQ